ncbi:MAG: hypothetical protein DMG03_01850 [Acidobacteria bacterium]|nr:MAG: hypothetical protein DMG03_01850 [Acidobacteriota bacterium]
MARRQRAHARRHAERSRRARRRRVRDGGELERAWRGRERTEWIRGGPRAGEDRHRHEHGQPGAQPRRRGEGARAGRGHGRRAGVGQRLDAGGRQALDHGRRRTGDVRSRQTAAARGRRTESHLRRRKRPRGLDEDRDQPIARETAVDVIATSVAGSPMIQYRGPFVVRMPDEAWFDVTMMQKDVQLALEMGRQLEVPLPTTAAVNEWLTAARAMGLGGRDFAAVFQALARVSGVDV